MRLSDAWTEHSAWTLFRENFDPPVVARFTIDGEPVSKARARFTGRGSKTRAYTPEKTRQSEEVVAWKFRQVTPGYKIDRDATYGVMALFFHATRQRRDVDNMVKLVLDGLNKVAWDDDDQVIEVSGRKSWVADAGQARTEVVVYRIGNVPRPTAKCEYCETVFLTYTSWSKRRFCSQECHYTWRRERRARTCANCGIAFQAAKPLGGKYCSTECHSAAKRATVACAGCGEQFTIQRCHVRAANYCSVECQTTSWRERRKSAAKGVCEKCGGPTSKKTYRQCAPCRGGNPTGKPRRIS